MLIKIKDKSKKIKAKIRIHLTAKVAKG
jgi:hypothetical protein